MQGENEERWMQLCRKAIDERDPDKLMQIMEQINRMLEEKEQRLKERRITSQGAASSMVRGKISRSGFVLFAIPR
jgi:hypothetical protein